MPGPGLWDDFMLWTSRNALASPSRTSTRPGNKRCYSTPIELYRTVNGKPRYWKTINPSVFVSRNNRIVITSIPSTTSRC